MLDASDAVIVLEAPGQRYRQGHAYAHQRHLFGGDNDPAPTGQGERVDGRTVIEQQGGGPQVAASHGRPVRVAVISWLRPPDSARRLTEEKPASWSIERSSPVGGR